MLKVRVCEDIEECAQIWNEAWPQKCLFDLWPVRACFASAFKREPYFLVAEEAGKIEGMMALSWIEEGQYWGNFPGETYQGKTWLEQNKIPAHSLEVLAVLLENTPGPIHLRYLTGDSAFMNWLPLQVDEEGYLFFPSLYNFSFPAYMQSFSGKSRKKLSRELAVLEQFGVTYRYDYFPDVERLFQMNLESFGRWSYFEDQRFHSSFTKLVDWLHKNGMLRVTTLLLGGTVAAIDIGALWGNTYTVLAGATRPEFPGVAKMINFHHMEWACSQHLEVVDFLCGDFGWKKRFHLHSRPLYEINRKKTLDIPQEYLPEDLYAHAQ